MAFSFDSPPTYAQIAARCPAIGTPTASYQAWMGNLAAKTFSGLSADFWGNDRALAAALLVAHAYLKDSAAAKAGGASTGKTTAKSVQDWAASYEGAGTSGITTGDADLASTVYGSEYLRLRSARAGRFLKITS